MPSPAPASVLDVRLAGAETYCVQFRCLRCGAIAERPAAYLVDAYGVETLGDVRRRARCLVYRGQPKRRCNGEAEVGLVVRRSKEAYGTQHAPTVHLVAEPPPSDGVGSRG